MYYDKINCKHQNIRSEKAPDAMISDSFLGEYELPSDEEDVAGRRAWSELTFRAGHRLRLSQATTATAIVLLHRFTLSQGKRIQQIEADEALLIATCLFLAGKVNETPRPLRAVFNVVWMLRKKRTLRDGFPPLDEAYFEMRDA